MSANDLPEFALDACIVLPEEVPAAGTVFRDRSAAVSRQPEEITVLENLSRVSSVPIMGFLAHRGRMIEVSELFVIGGKHSVTRIAESVL